ncbi:DUF2061 domain-containing protein [Roseateles cellulosilyticus]|uniref:DUF2061 domain-containing protein n=1 Tax=Pelomonas cellulosilytica TaxID=2906762 RepID=A0ABS8XXZ9_9BURK|nr:DUF2061 domain-containing protein [Pelomonas sp. P8]MCE4555717.1 DUF2061 domain-containing protein [Pelomonas sp. P8]
MAKTVSFGILHLGTSFGVTYALTGSVAVAGAVTFVEPLCNTVLHYFFDKYWDHPRAEAWRERFSRPRERRVQAA